MQYSELVELVRKIQSLDSESRTIEVKAANVDCPKKLYDTLSSFSNQDDGGIIVFGLDESKNFEIVGVYDAQELQKKINSQCKEMEPVVRPLMTVAEIEGRTVVSAEIPSIEIASRPCYYRGKGKARGSYIRCGDSDEMMTDYEIYSYEAYRKKYQDDIRTFDDLSGNFFDINLMNEYRALCKANKPHLARVDDDQFDEFVGITRKGVYTLTTILLFGKYPQGYFPQLSIVATVMPGYNFGELGDNGERFLDNKRIEGNIGDIIEGAIQFVKNNIRTSTTIDQSSGKRIDKPDYPLTAVREVILNALVHRDYSIHTEGSPIQLIMYEDRMIVKNPGGLYGRLTVNQLGKMQPDTRNPVLANALETLKLTENRYSGIPTIRAEMKNAGLPEPLFEDLRGEFSVTLFKRRIIDKAEESIKERLIYFCRTPRTRNEIANFLKISTETYAIKKYVKPLIDSGDIFLENTKSPNSPYQKYYSKI